MRKSSILLAIIILTFLVFLSISILDPSNPLNPNRSSGALSILILVILSLTIIAFVFEFETYASKSREISLVSMLGAVSAVSRVPFGPLPSFQPSTFFIICSGYVFGSLIGFMVGMLTALVSNFFFGQGPWTLYQMFAWGLVGASAGVLGRLKIPKRLLIPFGLLWGYGFGFLMNLWFLTAFGFPINLKSIISLQIVSFWMDTLHAVGNVAFLVVFGKRVIKILERFKARQVLIFTKRDSK